MNENFRLDKQGRSNGFKENKTETKRLEDPFYYLYQQDFRYNSSYKRYPKIRVCLHSSMFVWDHWGGFAYTISIYDETYYFYKAYSSTNAKRISLLSLLNALEQFRHVDDMEIITDSKYLFDFFPLLNDPNKKHREVIENYDYLENYDLNLKIESRLSWIENIELRYNKDLEEKRSLEDYVQRAIEGSVLHVTDLRF